MSVFGRVCIYVTVCVCMCVLVCVRVHECVCVFWIGVLGECMSLHTHSHIHTHTQSHIHCVLVCVRVQCVCFGSATYVKTCIHPIHLVLKTENYIKKWEQLYCCFYFKQISQN